MEKERLNPTLVYVLAIIGLLCCCFGGLGVILAAPAYFIAHTQIKKAAENPEAYEIASIKAMNTAKIVALVITIICALTLIYNIYDLASGGYEERMKMFEEIMKEYQKNQG